MEFFKVLISEVLAPASSFAVHVVGVLLAVVLATAWCLLVLLITGRIPWFVRKYF